MPSGAADDIERATADLRRYEPVGPLARGRLPPDGRELSWRLTFPGGLPRQKPWRFFIQWDQDGATRLAWDDAVPHPNGATRVDFGNPCGIDAAHGVGLLGEQMVPHFR